MQYNFDSFNKQNSSQKRTVHIKQNRSEQLITSYNTSEYIDSYIFHSMLYDTFL